MNGHNDKNNINGHNNSENVNDSNNNQQDEIIIHFKHYGNIWECKKVNVNDPFKKYMNTLMDRIGQTSFTSDITYYCWIHENNRIYPEDIIASRIQKEEDSDVIEILVVQHSGSG